MTDSDMADQKRLAPEDLRESIDAARFPFESTEEVEPLEGTIGQERALSAIKRGLQMQTDGFNIFAAGRVGTGRNSTIKALVEERAPEEPTPSDWVYVHNFDTGDEPNAIELPDGRGRDLREDMDRFIDQCQEEIPAAFEEESYQDKRNELTQQVRGQRREVMEDLEEEARELDHTLEMTPAGIAAIPMVGGQPLSQEEFENLPDEKQRELREKGEKVQEKVRDAISDMRSAQREAREEIEELDREVGLFAVEPLIENLKEKYSDLPEVVEFLEAVKEDIIDNVNLFKSAEQAQQQQQGQGNVPPQMAAGAVKMARRQTLNKYRANLVVDNSETEGAPIVDERNPTYYNLFGMIEYRAQLGGMTTDFTMIKAGAFQKASGGYLILQALDVLRNPFAWDGLKRAIRTGEVKIENMWERYHPTPTATITPESIPCEVKVILVGSPMIYHLLYTLDKDFRRLFKIEADFDVDMEMSEEHLDRYAEFVSAQCERAELPAFDTGAIARVVEHGARLAAHKQRLTTEFLYVADLIAEAGQVARSDGNGTVGAEHVQQAIEDCRYRSRKLQDRIQRLIEEDTILIDTEGAEPGQVNGLSVYDLGDYRFGKPTRITCVTAVGRAGVVNIERESELSGSIHDKGMLIMTGLLSRLFGQDKPLSLSAHLTFEQTYAEVEGDSASCAELYTLLSSLADLPLRQDVAVTGSVNQRGQVQPIGGVNEKVEGFYEVCRQKGLTGQQGVLIPGRNVRNLMLRHDVVEAVEDGRFNLWAVDTVREGIEVLTGVPAGERGEDGAYPEDSVFGRADRRLREMAEVLKEFGGPAGGEEDDSEA
ncbi:MAG: Lon protease family protein [Planctomycetota bacterium]